MIEIGPAGATRKMCHFPEGIMEQEIDFLKALEAANSFKIKNNELIIFDDSDEILVS